MEAARIATVRAERVIGHSPNAVYTFLERLQNHAQLGDRYLRLTSVRADGTGAWIVIGSPVGIRRTARTAVTGLRTDEYLAGTAAVGRVTRANVRWDIEAQGARAEDSLVVLEAAVLSASTIDRLLLAAGGRRWLHRRFRHALLRLSDALAAEPSAEVPIGA
jgi:hypothetical protein